MQFLIKNRSRTDLIITRHQAMNQPVRHLVTRRTRHPHTSPTMTTTGTILHHQILLSIVSRTIKHQAMPHQLPAGTMMTGQQLVEHQCIIKLLTMNPSGTLTMLGEIIIQIITIIEIIRVTAIIIIITAIISIIIM